MHNCVCVGVGVGMCVCVSVRELLRQNYQHLTATYSLNSRGSAKGVLSVFSHMASLSTLDSCYWNM